MGGGTEAQVRTQPLSHCYLCSSLGQPLYGGLRDRLVGVPGEWGHRRCPDARCGLVWLDPMPVSEDLGSLYQSYFTHEPHHGSDRGEGISAGLKGRERASLARHLGYPEPEEGIGALDRIRAESPFVRERARRSVFWLDAASCGRLLDVGCGNGQFLHRMQKLGWEVAGVDFDADAVRVARDHYGVDARHGAVEDADFEAGSFDVVTMEHVIEHLPDPRKTLEAAARLLRPGGRLAAVTPNFDSLDSRIHRADWYHLDPPRHLFLFSPASIRRCAEVIAGAFDRVEVSTCAAVARSTWGRSRLLSRARRRHRVAEGAPDERGYGYYKKVEGRVFTLAEHLLSLVAPVGEELVMFAHRA